MNEQLFIPILSVVTLFALGSQSATAQDESATAFMNGQQRIFPTAAGARAGIFPTCFDDLGSS